MDLFPDLFKLAWRKNKRVQEELVNLNWTRGLWKMQTIEEMANFVKLWDLVHDVQLSNEPDKITWKWTADGVYTAKSSYNTQFLGSFSDFNANSIWKAESKGKHNFFAWLLVQCKILTADKLMVRQWPCNPVCVLCNHEQETAAHLILHCPFARLVWEQMEDWTRELVHPPQGGLQINDWWQKELTHLPKKNKKNKGCVHDVQCLEYSRTNKEHQLTCYTRLRMKWRQEDWPAEGQSYLVLLMFNYLFSTFVSVFEFQIFYVISIL